MQRMTLFYLENDIRDVGEITKQMLSQISDRDSPDKQLS